MTEPDYSNRVFACLMRECPSLRMFNRFIVPLMRNETPELRTQAAAEAKRRGYKPNKERGEYE